MKTQPQRSAELHSLAQRLAGQRVAMLTLRDERERRLLSRPLTPREMDENGSIWLLVPDDDVAPLHGRAGERFEVNLAFADERRATYVSVHARAALVDDDAQRQRLLGAPAQAPLALLRVDPLLAEIWDGPSSSAVRVLVFTATAPWQTAPP
jgi:Pyridoxamine 5'-phosphate oxidase like